ncbi:MAG: NfeD family protein [Catalinimonas sp.]
MRRLLFALFLLLSGTLRAADGTVFVLEIRDGIDPRMSRYVELALEAAEKADADYIIIDMDTYGGAVDDADKIRTALLELDVPVWVFINKNAASAGALISIACDSIYMTPGASMGAATVVTGQGEAAPDKYQSYMRSTMRATAEATGRDPRVAEAMVDERIYIPEVTDSGQVLTLTATEAQALNFCEGIVRDINELLERNDVTPTRFIRYELSWAERVIAVFLNPFVSGLLILVILGGIYFELQSPGIGFPLLAAILAAVCYFVPYYLNGLAENWELILFLVGIALIGLEVFVIPGFGVAGIAGLLCALGGLGLMTIGNRGFDFEFVAVGSIYDALLTVLIAIGGFLALVIFGGFRLSNSRYLRRVALQDTMDRDDGYTSSFQTESMLGRTGRAYTILRPSGKIKIGDRIYDAYTRGEYVERDQMVEVISDEGTSLRVRAVEEEADK